MAPSLRWRIWVLSLKPKAERLGVLACMHACFHLRCPPRCHMRGVNRLVLYIRALQHCECIYYSWVCVQPRTPEHTDVGGSMVIAQIQRRGTLHAMSARTNCYVNRMDGVYRNLGGVHRTRIMHVSSHAYIMPCQDMR